jgi:biuret amidohydrolase
MTTVKKKIVSQPSPPPSSNTDFTSATRDAVLNRVEQDYQEFKKTRTFRYPTWLYGPIKGRLFKVEVEDCPRFGETAYVEFDSARTAFLSIDMQVDFCGQKGYVDVMGYDLGLTSAPIKPIHYVLYNIRDGTDIKVIYTREGHVPDLSDAPYNKVVDKAGKGAFGQSNLPLLLKNLGVTHLVITGITADVCVHTIMREANDYGYWCVLLKDGTGATDYTNYQAAIKQIKMQGGVFGWVSDSKRFVEGVKSAFKNK